jgi:hypothetical protein
MTTISAGQLMTYAEQQALAAVFLVTQSPAAAATYMSLLTNAASGSLDDTWTTMAQVTEYMAGPANGYARQSYGPGSPSVASPSVISNGSSMTWGPFTTSPATAIVWGMCCTAATGTTASLICAFLLATARTPISGDSLQAASASFTCQV